MVKVEIKGDEVYINEERFEIPAYKVLYFSEGIGYITFYIKSLEDIEKLEKLVKDKEFLGLYHELGYEIQESWERLAEYIRDNLDKLISDKRELEKLKKDIKKRLKLSYSNRNRYAETVNYIINKLRDLKNNNLGLFDIVNIKSEGYRNHITAIKIIDSNLLIIPIKIFDYKLDNLEIYFIDSKNNIYSFIPELGTPKSTFYMVLGKVFRLLEEKKYSELLKYITTRFKKVGEEDKKDCIERILKTLEDINNDMVDKIRFKLRALLI